MSGQAYSINLRLLARRILSLIHVGLQIMIMSWSSVLLADHSIHMPIWCIVRHALLVPRSGRCRCGSRSDRVLPVEGI